MIDVTATLVVVPARMASTRLPGKPLADINGKPMIVHVWQRAIEAAVGRVVVAAAEPEIVAAIEAAGGEAVLTDPAHPSGSDRVMEVVRALDPAGELSHIVNVQGDLPTLDPRAVQAALRPLADPEVDIATLVAPIHRAEERKDPNVVKAVLAVPEDASPGAVGRALYFSRATVPATAGAPDDPTGRLWHHIGLYAYRRAALERFVSLPVGVLERRERLEQLRALEAGMRIDAVVVDSVPLGVDTPSDLERARAMVCAR